MACVVTSPIALAFIALATVISTEQVEFFINIAVVWHVRFWLWVGWLDWFWFNLNCSDIVVKVRILADVCVIHIICIITTILSKTFKACSIEDLLAILAIGATVRQFINKS